MRNEDGRTIPGGRATDAGSRLRSAMRGSRYQVAAVENGDARFTGDHAPGARRDLPLIVVPYGQRPVRVAHFEKDGAVEFPAPAVHQTQLGRAVVAMLDSGQPNAKPDAPDSGSKGYFFFGPSAKMQELQSVVAQIAASDAPVLIQGEVGTGKEALARHLHALSPRSRGAFAPLHCTSHAPGLSDIELFGCETAAAGGVSQTHPGLLELSDGGTVLLADVAEADPRVQAKLLRLMQDGEFQRSGGSGVLRADVRVLAAAQTGLEQAVAEGRFLIDLYYALEVIRIHLPALRERREDILPLAGVLLARHAAQGAPLPAITSSLRAAMLEHDWPGNVRELENVMRRLLVLGAPDSLACELRARGSGGAGCPAGRERSLPPPGPAVDGSCAGTLEEVLRAKEQAERDVILGTLDATRWNRKRAAALLKSDYKAFLYKMKKLKIDAGRGAGARSLRA